MDVLHRRSDELGNSRGVMIFVVNIVFMFTSTLSVILRLLAKRVNKQKLVIEDYTILAALVAVNGTGICDILAVLLASLGQHADDIPASHVATFLKILIALQVLYGLSVGLVKTSIILFYIRVFFTRRFKIAAYTVIAFVIAWSVMVILVAFLLCTPIAFNWDHSIKGGKCANIIATFIAIGVLDLVTDCAVFFLPMPMIWGLKISRGNKIALFVIFGLGLFNMVLACLRVDALVKISTADVTYTDALPGVWTFLEPAVGITVACGPLLRPLITKTWLSQYFTFHVMSNKDEVRSGATFKRLEEPAHPLINYPLKTNETTVTAKNIRSDSPTSFAGDDGILDIQKHNAGLEGGRNIVVKKEWKMQRE